MQAKCLIQPALRLMKLELLYERKELKQKSFVLNSNILIQECLVDGQVYEILRYSELEGSLRRYEIPRGISKLELRYDSPIPGSHGPLILLRPEIGWFPDIKSQVELELRIPSTMQPVSDLKLITQQDGTYHMIGESGFILLIGSIYGGKIDADQYYTYKEQVSDVMLRGLRQSIQFLAKNFGRSSEFDHMKFIMVPDGDKIPPKGNIMFVEESDFKGFGGLQKIMIDFAKLNYPMQFAKDFAMMEEPIYRYLALRSLSNILSEAELNNLRGELEEGTQPIADNQAVKGEGVQFLIELTQASGVDLFQDKLQRLFRAFKDKPLDLTSFYNLFARESAPRAVLEKWLFGSRA